MGGGELILNSAIMLAIGYALGAAHVFAVKRQAGFRSLSRPPGDLSLARNYSLTLVTGAVLPLLAATSFATSDALDAKAQALNRKLLNIDAHTDVLIESTPERYWAPGHTSRTDLDKLLKGSVDAVTVAIAVGPGPRTPEGVAKARQEADLKLATIRKFVEQSGGRAQIALSADDIERLHKQGKVAVILAFQNARSLGKDTSGLDEFYKAGARVFGLTHAGNNDFADSSRPQSGEGEEHGGLSPLGKQAIVRLNELGALIDVSQLTPAGVFQVLGISRAPVIAAHSNVRTLVDNTRNLSDAELDAIKAKGGVVSVVPFNAYLARIPPDFGMRVAEIRKRHGLPASFPGQSFHDGVGSLSPAQQESFNAALRAIYPKATLEDYVDHIDYLVKRIGVDHVGIGTDFNHGAGIVGFDDESEAPNVTRELLRRGYTEQQIAKIWGGNFLRVLRQAEQAAKKARAT
jgi:membrane dipeptidase